MLLSLEEGNCFMNFITLISVLRELSPSVTRYCTTVMVFSLLTHPCADCVLSISLLVFLNNQVVRVNSGVYIVEQVIFVAGLFLNPL